MEKAEVVQFITPDKCVLNGLWLGNQKAKTAFIFVHGLGSSVFSRQDVLPFGDSISSLYFNNRGHDQLTSIKVLNPDAENGYERKLGGEIHEIFTECAEDIQGAVDFLLSQGVENIYLSGHSTGCQKSIYYLSLKRNHKNIKGVVLICPMSDYAVARKFKSVYLGKATKYAKDLVNRGRPHELMRRDLWPDELIDAQRFISLYTPDSPEEIFTYSHQEDEPIALSKVKIPTLVILANQDEYGDRPMKDIASWFKKKSKSKSLDIQFIDSTHNLTGKEVEVKSLIKRWVN